MPDENGGTVKAAFWRFAHSRYHSRKLAIMPEVALFTWFIVFAVGYGSALLAGWVPTIIEAVVGVMLVFGLLVVGLLHRRIRIEAAKGRDALYRKRITANRQR